MCCSERCASGRRGVVSAAWRAKPPTVGAPGAKAAAAGAGSAPAASAAPTKAPRRYRRSSGWGRPRQEAEEQRAWAELLPHLPEGGRLLWQALGDVGQFRRVLAEYGGRTLRVPAALPAAGHPLRRRLGAQCLRRLVASLGGTEVYVPTCRALHTRLRQQEIIREFSRETARGKSSVSAVAALAGKYALSDRRIWQILKTTPAAPRGVALLRELAPQGAETP